MKLKTPKRTDRILATMIIERIKEIRKAHNHSQEYVLENAGMDLGHIEVGRVIPSVVSISAFCKLYHITLDEFFAPMSYPPRE